MNRSIYNYVLVTSNTAYSLNQVAKEILTYAAVSPQLLMVKTCSWIPPCFMNQMYS